MVDSINSRNRFLGKFAKLAILKNFALYSNNNNNNNNDNGYKSSGSHFEGG